MNGGLNLSSALFCKVYIATSLPKGLLNFFMVLLDVWGNVAVTLAQTDKQIHVVHHVIVYSYPLNTAPLLLEAARRQKQA